MPKKKKDNELKEITLTPFLTNIINPSAKLLGIELKNSLKKYIDTSREEKRNKNIEEHIKKAKSKIEDNTKLDENNLSQLELLHEWIDGAQDVNPEDNTISEIWQELLVSIAKGNSTSKLLIEKLKSISPEEAIMLIKAKQQDGLEVNSDKEIFLLERLQKLSFIKVSYKNTFYTWFKNFVLLSILSVFISFGLTVIRFPYSIDSLSVFAIISFFIVINISTTNNNIFLNRKFTGRWYLTWLGEELIKYVPKKSNKTQEEERV